MRLYVALLHYPVYNKNYKTIASAVTTFDIHDLARLSKSYGVKRFFLVTPLEDQQRLARRLIEHWITGYGATYNPDRRAAVELVTISASLDDAIKEVEAVEGEKPCVVATDASKHNARSMAYKEAGKMIASDRAVILVFGTAWGLEKRVLHEADYVLDPIECGTGYNHLSVRSAAAIILDRIISRNWN
ncbi:MAG: RNA methyltransferase [Deltaproteobacteria bacterium]|nr:RNA methyltransferase [Deltaproteobacteria bacterium]